MYLSTSDSFMVEKYSGDVIGIPAYHFHFYKMSKIHTWKLIHNRQEQQQGSDEAQLVFFI